MAIGVKSFAGQNWAVTPVALAVNEASPASINDQKWQFVLTGVAIVDFIGNNANDWRRDTLLIPPDIIGSPLGFVLRHFGVSPPGGDGRPAFQLEQWAPFAAVSSSFSRETGTVDAGFAVDQWRPHKFLSDVTVEGVQVNQLFNGIDVDLAVRNNQAVLHRVSYHITLIGRVVFLQPFVG